MDSNTKERKREWAQKNKDRIKEQRRVLAAKEDPEVRRAKGRARYAANKERIQARARAWNEKNKEKRAKIRRDWNERNPGYFREHYLTVREQRRVQDRKRRRENRVEHNARDQRRKQENPTRRLACNLRSYTSTALKDAGTRKARKMVILMGCSMEFARRYIESLWKPGMSWSNYGRDGWHIDHIKPLIAHDLHSLEGQQAACHYTNLQPLWWFENLSKSGQDRLSKIAATN